VCCPQDDVLHPDLTIEETLTFNAKMRLPAISTRERCHDIVNDVIAVLDLVYIVNSVIGTPECDGISAGERRRVSIGIELVGDPCLLFLDEPTSGLNSAVSYAVVSALKKLTKKGANVITALHQPSYQIFELFDDAIFLINGGYSVYAGEASQAISFFSSQGFTCPRYISPPDFFMQVLSGKVKRANDPLWVLNDLVTLWNGYVKRHGIRDKDLTSARIDIEVMSAVRPVGFWISLKLFLKRGFIQQHRGFRQYLLECFAMLVAGALVGAINMRVQFEELADFIILAGLVLGLTTSIVSLRVFGNDQAIFWREASTCTGVFDVTAFFVAKNVVELPRIFILTLVFTLSLYPFANPSVEWHQFWLYCFFAAFTSSGFAYWASASLTNIKAQLAVVIYAMAAVVFSGMAIKLSALNSHCLSRALSYISFMRWFSELVYIREVYKKSIAWRMPPTFYQQKNDFSVLNGVLAYSFTPQSVIFILNLFMLCLIGIFFRLIAFWSLVILSRDKRGLSSVSDIVMPYSRFAFFRAQISKLDLRSLFTAVETTSASSLGQNHVTNRGKQSMVHSFSEVESYEPFDSGAQAAAESEAWNRRNGTGTVQVYGSDKICI